MESQTPLSYKKAILFMITAYACISLMGFFVKLSSAQLPSSEVLFSRFFIGFIFLIPLIKKDKNFSFRIIKKRFLLLRNGAGLLSMFLMFYGLKYLPVSTAVLLVNTITIFTPLLSFIFLKTRITLPIFMCTLVGFLGVYIILNTSSDIPFVYLIIGLSSAIIASFAFIGIKLLNQYNSSLQIVFYFYLTSVIVIPILQGYNWVMPSLNESYMLIMVGILGLIFQLCLTQALKYSNTNMITPFIFTGVIFSSLIDWLYWDHAPSLNFWLGAGIIIVSISVLARLESTK